MVLCFTGKICAELWGAGSYVTPRTYVSLCGICRTLLQDCRVFRRTHGQTERSARVGANLELNLDLLHKVPFNRKLDDPAGLMRIGIDTVVIRDRQVPFAARSSQAHHADGRCPGNDSAEASVIMTSGDIPDPEDGVVTRRSNIQNIAPWVAHQSDRATRTASPDRCGEWSKSALERQMRKEAPT
jgi:hypothetical protein